MIELFLTIYPAITYLVIRICQLLRHRQFIVPSNGTKVWHIDTFCFLKGWITLPKLESILRFNRTLSQHSSS